MSEYLDKLNQIAQQLKEEENGQQATRIVSKDCRNNDRSNNGGSITKNSTSTDSNNGSRSSNVLRRGIYRKELNNGQGKETKVMITVEAALKDLETIEVSDVTDGVKVVRALKVVVKFLSTMRSNQLLTDADRVNIQKAKANRKPEEKKA